MAETLKLGEVSWQITENEAEYVREAMAEGGPGFGLKPFGDEFMISSTEADALAAFLKVNKNKGDLTRVLATAPRLTVHQRVVKAMRAVSHVAKDGYNKHFNYPFRGIDGVVNALGPALREAGVFPTEEVISIAYRDGRTAKNDPTREVTVHIRITFWGEDGDSLTTEGVGESIDQSDKGTAKAMSVARRVAYLGVFLLPTQEPSTDHDGHYHQRGGQPVMSQFERNTGLRLLANPTPEQAEAAGRGILAAAFRQALDFRACIEEHSAWEQASEDETSPTWEELFAARVVWEIEAAATLEAARALWELLKAEKLDMAWEGKKFSQLIRERGAAIQAAQAARLNELTELLLSATTADGIGVALGMADADQDACLITVQQHADFVALAEERAAKVAREADVPVDAS